MAEVQTSTNAGEITQRFIEFVMMQAQNAALFLGQIPNPQTGKGEVRLEVAKMFIDQLEMIQEKTRGNLTNDEAMVLRNALSNLQMAYVEAAGEPGRARTQGARQTAAEPQTSEATQAQQEEQPPSTAPQPSGSVASAEPDTESRKKFTKSYGP